MGCMWGPHQFSGVPLSPPREHYELVDMVLGRVSEKHARIHCKDNAFYLTDLRSDHGTWITDIEGRRYRVPPNFPVRFHPSDVIEFGSDKAAFRVKVLKTLPETGMKNDNQILQAA